MLFKIKGEKEHRNYYAFPSIFLALENFKFLEFILSLSFAVFTLIIPEMYTTFFPENMRVLGVIGYINMPWGARHAIPLGGLPLGSFPSYHAWLLLSVILRFPWSLGGFLTCQCARAYTLL